MKIIFWRLFCVVIFAPIGIPAVLYAISKALITENHRDDLIEKFAVWYADKVED